MQVRWVKTDLATTGMRKRVAMLGEWYIEMCGADDELVVMLDKRPITTCAIEKHFVVFYNVPFREIETWVINNNPNNVISERRYVRKVGR